MIFTKLFIPPVPENFVSKPAVFEKLNEGLKRKLILVSAPAGYGKTTVLSSWIHKNNLQAAWCSLDSRENDPNEFLALIIKSIQKSHAEIGKSSLDLIESVGNYNVEYIIELLINDLLTLKDELVLVLDDLHLIQNKSIYQLLSAIIEFKPIKLKLAISTRSDPPIHFAKLRSQAEIVEIRSTDLSFSTNDISRFLIKNLNLDISMDDVEILRQKTEGWIAGLQLTDFTLKGQKDKTSYIKKIAGDNRYIMDYLLEEVLNTQDEEMEQFLLFTSILENLSGSLCDAVLNKDNSQKLLEKIEKSNMFLIPLDNERRWYRYHHMFNDLLRHKLENRYRHKVTELHSLASLWYENSGDMLNAIMHAIKGGDRSHAINLLELEVDSLFQQMYYTRIYKLGSIFTDDEIVTTPNLCLTFAWIMTLSGNLERSEYLLNHFEQNRKETETNSDFLGKVYLNKALIDLSRGNLHQAKVLSEKALSLIPNKCGGWRIWAYIQMAESQMFQFEIEKGLISYQSAIQLSKQHSDFYGMLAVSKTAYLLLLNGRYTETYNLCNNVIKNIEANPKTTHAIKQVATSILYSIKGVVEVERNILADGIKNTTTGYLHSKHAVSITFAGYCAYNYTEAYFKAGKTEEALEVINNLMSRLESDISIGIKVIAESLKNKILIEKQDFNLLTLPKNYALEPDKSNIFIYYFYNLAIARCCYYEGKFDEVLTILNNISPSLKKQGAFLLYIEAELLRARTQYKLNNVDEALQMLMDAVYVAQSERFIRTFIVEGNEIFELLKKLKQLKIIKSTKQLEKLSTDFINDIIEAFEAEGKTKHLEADDLLSARELDTLEQITEGLSNQEIAEKLFISITTVKTHVRNILIKLNAKNRNEAVAIARKNGVLKI